MMSSSLYGRVPYSPPLWADLPNPPLFRLQLGRFPTPLHKVPDRWAQMIEGQSAAGTIRPAIELWIKRDDLTSHDLSGNKVRKLEFLLEEALREGYDSVLTIGGVQSNHCRATAVAARQVGLNPRLILRSPKPDEDPGLVGNLLLDRLVGAEIDLVSPAIYAQIGSAKLLEISKQQMIKEGKNPYLIPVGGSNAIGSWGYIEAVNELTEQMGQLGVTFDHIVFACGSGGTATGIALAVRMSGLGSKVHAVGVCDSPEYFYAHMDATATALGTDRSKWGAARDWCTVHAGQGIGYARSTEEELTCLTDFSRRTGIVLDPVYSGKALFFLINALKSGPQHLAGL